MAARRLSIVVAALCVSLLLGPRAARAELLTFHLPAAEALASVGRTNAFLVSLGKKVRGVKLVPGGTRFAGQTCAALGDVYKLGAVTVLDGPAALRELVPTRGGRDAAALETALTLAGVARWIPPATTTETDIPFWAGSAVPHGVRFAADGLAFGSDDGLLASPGGAGVLRFRADVAGPPDGGGRYRFLVELFGRTSSDDAALVAYGERRCFTFLDLRPVDLSAVARLVDQTVASPQLRLALHNRLDFTALAIERRDFDDAIATLAVFTSLAVSRSPEAVPPAVARQLVEAAFHLRRGLLFKPFVAVCGNGVRETGEACDGADLGAFTCQSIGFQSGTLGCRADCRFETAGCVANPVCGNGVLEIGEQCDRGAENSDTVVDACRTNCRRAFCGDDVIDSFEDCEPGNLGGADCESLGYDRGSLRCDADSCFFDDEHCSDNEED